MRTRTDLVAAPFVATVKLMMDTRLVMDARLVAAHLVLYAELVPSTHLFVGS